MRKKLLKISALAAVGQQRVVRTPGWKPKPMLPNEVPRMRGDMIMELLYQRERATRLSAHLMMVNEPCLTMRSRIPISDIGLSDALWSIANEAKKAVES